MSLNLGYAERLSKKHPSAPSRHLGTGQSPQRTIQAVLCRWHSTMCRKLEGFGILGLLESPAV